MRSRHRSTLPDALPNTVAWLIQGLEQRYDRGLLLEAYLKRHRWNKSDKSRLNKLPLNDVARRRVDQLSRKGRPTVGPNLSLEEFCKKNMPMLAELFGADVPPNRRKQALKSSRWWPHYVEALYRGEHALAKAHCEPNPSLFAEVKVGNALAISGSTVHTICGQIRCMRNDDPQSADFEPMTLTEFEQWMATGQNPRWH
jgi:hypothetical protein